MVGDDIGRVLELQRITGVRRRHIRNQADGVQIDSVMGCRRIQGLKSQLRGSKRGREYIVGGLPFKIISGGGNNRRNGQHRTATNRNLSSRTHRQWVFRVSESKRVSDTRNGGNVGENLAATGGTAIQINIPASRKSGTSRGGKPIYRAKKHIPAAGKITPAADSGWTAAAFKAIGPDRK